ncbi:MAG: phenylalanine--tRNA ligase subunit beta [Candidatus Pacebacteria bacterium]|nr:phenylalanine--tRNA ligase subunit beta [Candidatus Paceibacterota bacterium]
MLISRHWLSKFFDVELPHAETLSEALTFHAFEIDGITAVGDDSILDVKVTPNRGHDSLGYRGIAKEISAILKIPLTHDPLAQKPDLSLKAPNLEVFINEPALCPRYVAGVIEGVNVGPSPEWLRKNLEAMGQRSINNVVDATNFVMFNLGQPLHAFDAKQLMARDGKYSISVRRARGGEGLTALDQKQYILADSMLAIVDANADAPIGVAGVKGGLPAGISEATTNIILESANFDGVSVRRTAQGLKLRTDASSRFEQGLSPELAAYGMQAAVELILKLAGGELKGFVDTYPEPQKESRVSVSLSKINAVLGTHLTAADVADAFSRLGFAYKEEGGVFEVVAPFERLDLSIPEDLVEEVGRIVGYDKVPAVVLPMEGVPAQNNNHNSAERAREELVSQGYSEVFTSVFADKGERAVLNKVDSVRPYLRASLVQGLTEALEKNKQNRELLGLKEVKLFEIGTVWKGGQEVLMLGTITEKQKAAEKVLDITDASPENLPLSTTERYKTFSRYPYMVRDIAMWTPAGTSEAEVQDLIKKEAGELAQNMWLFDRFEKEGKVSLAYRIIFQTFDRTLTEPEANAAMEKVSSMLKGKGFEIR